MVLLLAVVYRSAAIWVPKVLACRDSRTMPSSLAKSVTRVTVLMTWMVLFCFILFLDHKGNSAARRECWNCMESKSELQALPA